jgi:hypothetical protein
MAVAHVHGWYPLFFRHICGAGNSAGDGKESTMTLTDVCILLGAIFTFATLVLKVVEVSRTK